MSPEDGIKGELSQAQVKPKRKVAARGRNSIKKNDLVDFTAFERSEAGSKEDTVGGNEGEVINQESSSVSSSSLFFRKVEPQSLD